MSTAPKLMDHAISLMQNIVDCDGLIATLAVGSDVLRPINELILCYGREKSSSSCACERGAMCYCAKRTWWMSFDALKTSQAHFETAAVRARSKLTLDAVPTYLPRRPVRHVCGGYSHRAWLVGARLRPGHQVTGLTTLKPF